MNGDIGLIIIKDYGDLLAVFQCPLQCSYHFVQPQHWREKKRERERGREREGGRERKNSK